MNTGTRLALFGVTLAVTSGLGALVGDAVGPIDTGASGQTMDTHVDTQSGAQSGYTLISDDTEIGGEPFSFTITGPDGEPVTDYEVLHEKQLHLIVVSTGLHTYAHLHPERDSDGRWSIGLPELPAGKYRAVADFAPDGAEQMNLGVDLVVPGWANIEPPLEQALSYQVDDFDVTLEAADSDWSEVVITVRRGDDVVTTEPYLGAAGHLVAIAADDLAYLHTHALDETPAGPVRFEVELLGGATHALYFDFKVDGEVHTAQFVIESEGSHGASTEHGN